MNRGTYVALSGALVRQQLMDTISHNLSNNETVGFKKGQSVFKTMLERVQTGEILERVNLAEIEEGFTDFSQGTLSPSGIQTHMAIQGEGFFKVEDEAGNIYYTRQGNLRLDYEGHLINNQGMALLGEDRRPITLTSPDFTVDDDGTITLEDGQKIKIPLYTFDDYSVLTRQGGGQFSVPKGQERDLEILVKDSHIYQGQLERSNVNLMQEMSHMVESTRVFEACQKMLKTYHSIAAEANKLGTLG
ncbi:flagellar basal body rod protein FlgF [Syntrophotalea carbinolica DSM 2380]|uniref:Flagellar basal body rod protein FlgF n=1 Tax=Syntrophotalea carbinolica (strain DSM 2380 / NBRC 103641 / GraBd1) TaxID=338963 RepID=Q3A5F1_SYNC1|nr:flagellar hook basal-body protein [Syntrophotalea carbinolica]ABA88406.1 flagellar basal body rod protein FlgF [Syntrophotalea carbinolica DSM 2380]